MKMAGLIDHVAEHAGLDRKTAKKATQAFIEGIMECVKRGEDVDVSGFGKFKLKDLPERMGRNEQTGEEKHRPALRTVAFAASKSVRDALGS